MKPLYLFTLRTGWKVKDVEVTADYGDTGDNRISRADWQWVRRPDKGSDSPYMKVRLVANFWQRVYVYVKVWIEGPAGTDPYN